MIIYSGRVKSRRLALGLKQEVLALNSGIGKSTIQKYEYGDVEVSNKGLSKIPDLAAALNCSVEYLTGQSDDIGNPPKEISLPRPSVHDSYANEPIAPYSPERDAYLRTAGYKGFPDSVQKNAELELKVKELELKVQYLEKETDRLREYEKKYVELLENRLRQIDQKVENIKGVGFHFEKDETERKENLKRGIGNG